MTEQSSSARAVAKRWLRSVSLFVLAVAALVGGACSEPPAEERRDWKWRSVHQLPQHRINKLDLLLVVDNSEAMGEKQALLAEAIPDLLNPLIAPPCVDSAGQPIVEQPQDGGDCPAGSLRRYTALRDIHIGVLSSSLGGHGSDACSGSAVPSENDGAHLIARSGTEPDAPSVQTWNDSGFLVWDPNVEAPTHNPPGLNVPEQWFEQTRRMITGAGVVGCGYEAPLEAWYRFLIDPDPYLSITLDGYKAVPSGTDNVLLDQRRRFLRPDSMLVVLMLSDENDCSIRDGSQFYYALQQQSSDQQELYHLPKPRAACAVDPADPCCRSCGQVPGDGCDTTMDNCDDGPLELLDDQHSLRCFDQKRRFGIDFMYPIERYVTGLTSTTVTDRYGDPRPNPLYDIIDPNLQNTGIKLRTPDLVLITGVVGVPWQDIARRDAGGTPDLLAGLNAQGEAVGGYQDALELHAEGTWPFLVGSPSTYQPPNDPFMIESIEPRQGQNPKTGEAIQPPGAGEGASAVNGHERSISQRDDLQYACIFPLATPRDCSTLIGTACECTDPGNDNPLCVPNPNDGGQRTLQRYDKAYPGRRILTVLRDMGAQAVTGSICPAQRSDQAAADYALRPSITALLEAITPKLIDDHSGVCVPYQLDSIEGEPESSCHMVEARQASSCDCNHLGRNAIDSEQLQQMVEIIGSEHPDSGFNCFCEVMTLTGDALDACRNDEADPPLTSGGEEVHGWCFVSEETGNPLLSAHCPQYARQRIRLAGGAKPQPGAELFFECIYDE